MQLFVPKVYVFLRGRLKGDAGKIIVTFKLHRHFMFRCVEKNLWFQSNGRFAGESIGFDLDLTLTVIAGRVVVLREGAEGQTKRDERRRNCGHANRRHDEYLLSAAKTLV